MSEERTIFVATRGSALALAQANSVLAQCRAAWPNFSFELKVIKTTGDKLQTASMAQEGKTLPKGLFTKELETALLERKSDLAIHSLKDLPTELPSGLRLGAVLERADVRDVLVYRSGVQTGTPTNSGGRTYPPGLRVGQFPKEAVIATSSTRRRAQLLVQNPFLTIPEIRGNVPTRLTKLHHHAELDATVLALAGLMRLKFSLTDSGVLEGEGLPPNLSATILDTNEMLPCVGQGAIGIEIRDDDPITSRICERLNHLHTFQAVSAERAFLEAMGGGCQSPVAAYARLQAGQMQMRAISFADGAARQAEGIRPAAEAIALGQELAEQLRSS